MTASLMNNPPASRRRERRLSPIRFGIAVLLAATYVYPFLFMIAVALKPQSEYNHNPIGWPSSLTLSNLRSAWTSATPNLGLALLNSLVAVSIGTVLCCVITSLAAFWFLRNKSKVSRFLLAAFGSLWILPQVVWLIPFFIILSNLNLTDNLVVLGIVYGSVLAPGFIWLLWVYFLQGIPDDVLQAAEVDGASMLQQFLRIVLPLSLPALGTVAALCFVFAWGDLLLAVVLLQTPSNFTATVAAASLVGRFGTGVQQSAAAAVITIAPSLIVFLIAQKAIIRGITGGFSR